MTPFEALGLDPDASLTDDDVRAAWRRIAEATHPDRADGGDLAVYVAAAAAYTELRTPAGRGDALAGLREGQLRGAAGGRVGSGLVSRLVIQRIRLPLALPRRVRDGRPLRLALRLLAVGSAGALVVEGTGWTPGSLAVLAGAATWAFLTGRGDLAR